MILISRLIRGASTHMSKRPEAQLAQVATAQSGEQREVQDSITMIEQGPSAPLSIFVPTTHGESKFTGERFLPGMSSELELEHLHRYLFAFQFAKGRHVLDIACGEGYGSFMLSQIARSVVGVDIDSKTVADASTKYCAENLSYKIGSCIELPLSDCSVDLVVSFETLEHIAEHDQFMLEIKRVLRPEGILIMSSPERDVYASYREGDNEFHAKELNRAEFKDLLAKHFRNARIGAQRNLFGSVISGAGFESSGGILSKNEGVVTAVSELQRSPYLIAVSSDKELPPIQPSIFDGGMSPYIISALRGGIEERDAQIGVLREGIEERDLQIGALRGGIEERDAQTGALREGIEERDLQIGALRGGIEERDAQTGALREGIEKRDLQIGALREVLISAQIAILELEGCIQAAATATANASQRGVFKRAKRVVQRVAYRKVFESPYLSRRVGRLLEKICRRVFKRIFKLTAPPYLDVEFFVDWNPEVRVSSERPLEDYCSNWAPVPRSWFKAGELSSLLHDIKDGARRCENLRMGQHDSPTISIVIPVYNQLRITLRAIRSILQAGAQQSFEIIIVDDCSEARISTILGAVAGIRYLQQPNNSGFIASCNNGANAARGDYLVFLNNDTHVLPGWLDELHRTFIDRPKAGLVGSQLIYPTGALQEAGGILWSDGSGWNYGRNDDRLAPQYNYLRPVDYCSGASIMVPRLLFNELGQFDSHYSPAYAEDADLALQVRKAGYEVLYQPQSKVVHFEGVSSGTDTATGTKSYQVQNLKKLFQRWQNELSSHRPNAVEPELERDRGVSKRVLFLDATTPTPDCDAGSVVIYQFMKIFLKIGYGVSFVPVDNLLAVDSYTEDLQRMGVECWHHPFISSVDDYLAKHGKKFDLIFMYRAPHAARHLDAVRMYAPQAKVVLNTVDLHFLREERQAQVESSETRFKMAQVLKERELSVMHHTDATILLNKSEVELIRELAPTVKTFMLPLTQDIPGCRRPFPERKDIVFIGGFNHLPNIDAVKYFSTEIMPLIRELLPGVRFIVVGSNPPEELSQYACKDIEIRGFVANLAEVFDICRVSVAPLRFGAGMKGKIVTSLSYGVPCITTTIGAEGMGLSHGRNILIADDAVTCAQAVVDVYNSEEHWHEISSAGVDFARANFSADVVEKQIQGMLLELEKVRQFTT